MAKQTVLKPENLRNIFILTAIVTLAVGGVSWFVDAGWSLRYLFIGTLALINWWALGKILGGVVRKNLVDIAKGGMLKPLLLVLLLIAGKHGGIEITSFLAGLNTFFLTLFGYLMFRSLRSGGQALTPLPSGNTELNG